ncbi:glyoxalase/bleomycin resistance/dioxygenase family protein [Chromobacterium sp. ATCC 53434]|uniref:ArsI/CadI family heavy metal resistance metalloenzyme n=1 Tax=Chromobacterium sp. (strain ATCC 53434 / SC 14030) TaxID=2059672 RepID=UPI000C777CEF|nr:ArsI/CadI family heavy metal resistance metalloenzyme [Chromobacterium sp. ATCC 53434]AUH49783.1 glyoxalase/bleomycin resistance/dioxygenase family protein [Chromobacterium sp. ATCC 53434]
MKRFHVHVAVANLEDSIRFYSALFNAQPTVQKTDYAKWMLEDPRLNFAISSRGAAAGVDHLGFQVDSEEELAQLQHQLQAADISMVTQTGTACCYAESNKHWVTDPSGLAWESYQTLASIPTFNGGESAPGEPASACCAPKTSTVKITPKNTCAPGSGCC